MDPTADVNPLSGFEGRVAGSDAERRAALSLRERLLVGGHDVAEIEPFRFHQRWALAQALAAGLAVVGSVVSVSNAAVGCALVAFAAAASIAETAGVVAILGRLTGTRASQNVSAPAPASDRPGLLVLAASYDAPRVSSLTRLIDRAGRPWRLLGAIFVALLLCCLARLGGAEGDLLTAVQVVPTLLLLATVPLLVDAELAPLGDGAAEAVGVEIAIDLARQLRGELEQLDVWLVLAGAGGALGAGMRAWRRRHRRELDARPTVTIEVGAPELDEAGEIAAEYAELARRLDAQLAGR
jgi:hypothetical protein